MLRSFGNYDVDKASLEAGIAFDPEEGKTQQQFKDEVDINTIVKRFGLTGEVPDDFRMPQTGDFTGVTDYHSAMNMVIAAQEAFLQVPADVRERFAHDPGKLMSFLEDEKNRDEAIKLGLVNAPVEKTRDAVQAIDELAAKMAGGTPKP